MGAFRSLPARRKGADPRASAHAVRPPVPDLPSPSRPRRPRGRHYARQARSPGCANGGRQAVRAGAAIARSQASPGPGGHRLQSARRPPEPRPFPSGGILRARAPTRRRVRRARAQDRGACRAGRLPIYAARQLRAGVRLYPGRPRTAVDPQRACRLAGRAVRQLPARPMAPVSVEYPLESSAALLPAARSRSGRAGRAGGRIRRHRFGQTGLRHADGCNVMAYLVRPIERQLKLHLTTEVARRRFDRAKRFVDAAMLGGDVETAQRANARWLKFLCSREPVQTAVWPEEAAFLRHFATVFGLPAAERREFLGLSLLGRFWRASCFADLWKDPDLVAKLTRAVGWEHFDRCRQGGTGLILLPVHGQFARLFRLYLRHRGHDGLEVGLPSHKLEKKGLHTPAAKQFELARQMHAAKQLLKSGGVVFNLPDAFQNLDHSYPVEFFGRERRI